MIDIPSMHSSKLYEGEKSHFQHLVSVEILGLLGIRSFSSRTYKKIRIKQDFYQKFFFIKRFLLLNRNKIIEKKSDKFYTKRQPH